MTNFTAVLPSRLRGVFLALVLAASFALVLRVELASAYSGQLPNAALEAPYAPQQQEAAQGESDAELPWLFAVFIITWAAFFGYVFFMSRRQREMQREIEALKRLLDEREGRQHPPGPGPEARAP